MKWGYIIPIWRTFISLNLIKFRFKYYFPSKLGLLDVDSSAKNIFLYTDINIATD
jgi:hypothetical protein